MNPDIPVIKIMISKINTFIQVGLESIKKKNLPSICHFLFHTTVLQWIPEYKGLKFINTILIYLLFFILDGSETIFPDRAKRSDLDPQHCFLQNFLLDFLLLPFWSSIPVPTFSFTIFFISLLFCLFNFFCHSLFSSHSSTFLLSYFLENYCIPLSTHNIFSMFFSSSFFLYISSTFFSFFGLFLFLPVSSSSVFFVWFNN